MTQTRREFVKTLFVATQGVVASRFLSPNLLAAPEPGGLNFLVFGDWGRQGEEDQTEVAAQMAKAAQEMEAKFVISVGDNFYEDGVKSVTDPHWRASFEDVYHQASLQVPWHCILGNHDYHANCDAQIAYHATSLRWNMPNRYYVQSHQIEEGTTADFFYIDTSPFLKSYHKEGSSTRKGVVTQDVPKQLDWLKSALAASKAPWKIVFGHHPIYSGGEHGDTPELIESVLPLLHEYKVQAYFNGHDHDLQHLMAGEINLFDSGAGSQFRPTKETQHTKWSKACSGFTAVSLGRDRMDVRMIDNLGTAIYATTVKIS
jgi:tartrate-resistant acid phosphatase type 5